MERINILGAFIHSVTMDEALLKIKEYVKHKTIAQVITINPEMVYESLNNQGFQAIINEAQLVIPDGHGIVWAAQKLGYDLKDRVPGIELMDHLLAYAEESGLTVFFYGGKKDIIKKSVDNIRIKYPDLKIVGYTDGYLDDGGKKDLIKILQNEKPDFLFVGLGSPKQEFFIHECLPQLAAPCVAMGVGGSFDVFSGETKRAPIFWQKIHMEWLYRGLLDKDRRKRLFVIPKYMKAVKKQSKHIKQ